MKLRTFPASITKHLRRAGSVRVAASFGHHLSRGTSGILPIIEEALETAAHHLLEADDENAVGAAVSNGVPSHRKAGRASRAVIIDVEDGDLGHAELVEDALATCRIPVAVARDTLLDVVVVDMRVEHGFNTSFEAELRIVDFAAGLDELGHAHTEHVHGLLLFGGHLEIEFYLWG